MSIDDMKEAMRTFMNAAGHCLRQYTETDYIAYCMLNDVANELRREIRNETLSRNI